MVDEENSGLAPIIKAASDPMNAAKALISRSLADAARLTKRCSEHSEAVTSDAGHPSRPLLRVAELDSLGVFHFVRY